MSDRKLVRYPTGLRKKFMKTKRIKYTLEVKQKDKEYRQLDTVRNAYYKKRFGITLEEYNYLYDRQNGCCLICMRSEAELGKRLVCDHDHSNGQVRGLLCSQCNKTLGSFKDDIERFKKAIRYLQGDL